jgi:hypothetical protein
MATTAKNFKVKYGLIVEGQTGTIDGNDILTKNTDSDDYILDLVGGVAYITSVGTNLSVTSGLLSLDLAGIVEDIAGTRLTTDGSTLNVDVDSIADDLTGSYDFATNSDISGAISTEVTNRNDAIAAAVTDLEAYADQAELDAVSTANSYTDDRETAITTAYQTYADQAETDAKAYTDTRETAITTAYQSYADTAESDAVSTANSYTDGEITTALTTAQGYADTAEANANAYTDNAVSGLNWKQAVNLLYDAAIPALSGSGASQLIIDGHDPLGDSDSGYRVLITQSSDAGIYVFNSTSGNWTLTRSDDADEFGELIGSAVYVMEGTQYGSTSWVQSNHYITDFTGQSWTQFSGQGSVTAGEGIAVDGLEVSIDRTTVDDWYEESGAVSTHSDLTTGVHGVSGDVVGTSDSQTLTNKTIDASSNTISNIANSSLTNSSITVNGYATALGETVTLDTDDVSEGSTNQYFTQTRARDSFSEGTGINIATGEISVDIAAFDSDDISEGTGNLYFTDGRAADAAAALLTSANQTNISITGTGAGLTITAENGVAGSTTDDLTEGEDNLYFTDERVIDAVDNAVINPQVVEINMIARQVAAVVADIATATTVTAYTFAKADYRSAKFLVKTAYGVHTELSEVLITLDTSDNIAITEYATIGTNGSSMVVSADISGTDVRLRVQTLNNDSTVTVMGTLLV